MITKKLDDIFLSLTRAALYLIIFLIVAFIGVLDFVTGYEIHVFIFYALPIAIATWYVGYRAGLLFAFVSIFTWYVADYLTDHAYSSSLIPTWNGLIRFAFFSFSVYALHIIREKLDLEESYADFDSLTSSLNGRGFRTRLPSIFSLIKREKQKYTMVFLDVDNFKTLNDTKGHAEGDKALQSLAEVMHFSFRSSDLICRKGGDEFILFLPNTDSDQAKKAISLFKERFDKIVQNKNWPIGLSIGACTFDSEQTDIEHATLLTDNLMYEAKNTGKNTIVFKTHIS